MFRRSILGFLTLVLLVACGQSGNPSQPTDSSTPRETTPPTQAVSPATLTASPVPSTVTLEPTATLTRTPTLIPSSTATPAPVILKPENFLADVTLNPLTGLPAADAKLLERRPVAVKVNIVPRYNTRPPWGLSFADIVYDYYHNDGYGRLHAIFYGNNAELVGPVRSGRLLDGDLIRMYQSIFAYGSADAQINSRLLNAEYWDRLILEGQASVCPPTAAKPLCRFEPGGADHLLGGIQALSEFITAKGVANGRQNLNGMSFSNQAATGGSAGTQVYTRYSGDYYNRWDYDPAMGRYLRFQDNVYDQGGGEAYAPLIDRLTEKQIAADNVVIILVPHVYFTPPPNEIVEILLSGAGKAYAFRDGQAYEVVWNRPSLNSVLFLTYADGTPYYFKPGNTWFQVVGETSKVTQPGSGIWRFEFLMP